MLLRFPFCRDPGQTSSTECVPVNAVTDQICSSNLAELGLSVPRGEMFLECKIVTSDFREVLCDYSATLDRFTCETRPRFLNHGGILIDFKSVRVYSIVM